MKKSNIEEQLNFYCISCHLRFFTRYTNFKPDQISSTAQTFMSTKPLSSPIFLTSLSVNDFLICKDAPLNKQQKQYCDNYLKLQL